MLHDHRRAADDDDDDDDGDDEGDGGDDDDDGNDDAKGATPGFQILVIAELYTWTKPFACKLTRDRLNAKSAVKPAALIPTPDDPQP